MGRLKEYLSKLKDKKAAVIGAGISNTPLIKALLEEGIRVTVRDRRSGPELGNDARQYKEAGAELRLGSDYLEDLNEDVIFRTPGLMPHNPALRRAKERGAVITSEMEVFFEVCPCMIIGITGSDGKTTTAMIIAKMLENQGKTVHLGGNIGTPLLCRSDEMNKDDIAVVELSSFQLITMRRSPDIAVITNITPNHLDIHKDMEEYIRAKRNIYLYQKPQDRLVLSYDNDITRGFIGTAPADNVSFFSLQTKTGSGAYLADNGGVCLAGQTGREETVIMDCRDILLPGLHNTANYLAAFAAVKDIVSTDVMRKTARTFGGAEHRLEFVRETGGVRYYNDSVASGPTRTIAGLRSFDQKVILIAGGKDKAIPFDELGSEINLRVKKLILTGAAAQQIHNAVLNAPEYDGSLDIEFREGFEEAITAASESAVSGDIVLLSPACTSFDRFSNFEERGKLFKEIIKAL